MCVFVLNLTRVGKASEEIVNIRTWKMYASCVVALSLKLHQNILLMLDTFSGFPIFRDFLHRTVSGLLQAAC